MYLIWPLGKCFLDENIPWKWQEATEEHMGLGMSLGSRTGVREVARSCWGERWDVFIKAMIQRKKREMYFQEGSWVHFCMCYPGDTDMEKSPSCCIKKAEVLWREVRAELWSKEASVNRWGWEICNWMRSSGLSMSVKWEGQRVMGGILGTTIFKVLKKDGKIIKEKRMSGHRGGRRIRHMFSWKPKR